MSHRNKHFLAVVFALATVCSYESSQACTILSCSLNGEVFAAANEDDYSPFARVWFNPRTKERFGSVCFGANDLQAAAVMNEYGLFCDFTAQYGINPAKYNLKNPYYGNLVFEILGKCKTVKEALTFMETRDYAYSSQVLLADADGASVVINPGEKVLKSGSYQINTNFNIAQLKTGNYSCGRYNRADALLKGAKTVSVSLLRKVLQQTHQEGPLATQYSAVYDLKRRLVYVYLFHDFENVVVMDLKNELEKGYRLQRLDNLFPKSFAYKTMAQAHSNYQKETILDEIEKSGLNATVDGYLAKLNGVGKSDSALKASLLEVAIQLVRNAWNQHADGSMWEYWFSLPGGYTIRNMKDVRLGASEKLLIELIADNSLDKRMRNFLSEMQAYINLLQGNKPKAIALYKQAVATETETYAVSYSRAKKMLAQLEQ